MNDSTKYYKRCEECFNKRHYHSYIDSIKICQRCIIKARKHKLRKCLRCDKEFKHQVNRICGACKLTAEWIDADMQGD